MIKHKIEVVENVTNVANINPERPYEQVVADCMKDYLKYRKLEEQGLLLKLPCKVGDIAYNIVPRVSEESTYREDKVTRIEIYDDSVWMCFHNGLAKNVTQIGKSVFLTKEEAEQKLKEMESDK